MRVGKSFLGRRFQAIADDCGALTAFVDESSAGVLPVMLSVAAQFRAAGGAMTRFERRAVAYER
jgi:hypothetical protein